MKKVSILFFIFFIALFLVGCEEQNMTFASHPIGYNLINDTYVAKGSFVYRSNDPYKVNQVSLELYYLPSIWGEIEIDEEQQITEDNPNFIITDYNTLNQKVFAKYIHIGDDTWTATIENAQIIYIDENGDDILEVLVDEQKAKAYIEALETQNAYFLDSEMVMLSGYMSILDTQDADDVFQKQSNAQLVMINWDEETISAFPDLSNHFSDYDSTEINTLYLRVFEKAEDPEYRTSVYYN